MPESQRRPWYLWIAYGSIVVIVVSDVQLIHHHTTVNEDGHGPFLLSARLTELLLLFGPIVSLVLLVPFLWGLKRLAWGYRWRLLLSLLLATRCF